MRRFLLLVVAAACQPMGGAQPTTFTPMTAEQAQWAQQQQDACSRMCTKYLDCKNMNQPQTLADCVGNCQPETVDPTRVAQLEQMDCPTFVATLEGGGQQQQQQQQQQQPGAVGGGNLAGVWVAEESSLTPGIYMSLTQYLTFYPDGGVGYRKSEGGASRTQISDSMERFRSWHEGAPANDRIIGRWQSDGASVVVQFSVWNNLRSQGQVRGRDEITLSGMGALEEGATLTFRRQ